MNTNGPSVVDADPFACVDPFAHAIGCIDESCAVCALTTIDADQSDALVLDGIGLLPDTGFLMERDLPMADVPGNVASVATVVSDSDVANDVPVDSGEGALYGDSCAGYVRSSHDDAPGNRVTGRHASTKRSDTDRAASSRTGTGTTDVTTAEDEAEFWPDVSTPLRVRVGTRVELSPLTMMIAAIVVSLTMWAGLPTVASAEEHEVVAGDTLWTIAANYGVSIDELIALNEIENPSHLRIGDRVLLPEPPYEGATLQHIVQPGETLTAIAELYDVEADSILRLNELPDANQIKVAEVLEIPDLSTLEDQADDEYILIEEAYVVQAGDTLTAIAEAHDVEPGDIVRASGLLSANIIRENQVLAIPKLVKLSPTERYAAMFETWAEANELDPNLMKALGWQESRWQPDAVSYAGAVGMTQIMPGTRDYIADELIGIPELSREDPEENIRMGSRYLAYLLELSQGDLRLALGSYYQGFTSVTRNGYRPDTVRYVDSILAYVPRFESGELPG